MTTLVRRGVPLVLLPLALLAVALASTLWLRAYPGSVLAVPLFGAALLSTMLPIIVVGIGVRRLWLTALIDVAAFIFFTTLVALREPVGLSDLYAGLVHGPAQILTFALPLVSPRTLLVAPIALCWLSGSVIGECIARGWQSIMPYATLLTVFALSYAGSARAISSSAAGRRYDTLLAAGLLLCLLLLRAAQAWIGQDEAAESTQPDGVLPLRGLAIGILVSALVAGAATLAGQAGVFAGSPTAPARKPPLDQTTPLTPLSFVAGLRPTDPGSPGTSLFTMSVSSRASRYVALGDLDTYDGDSWTFERTFRPSGGALPADADPLMRPSGRPIDQQYRIDAGPMTTVPWIPFLYRPQKVIGTPVDIDTASGMIVPGERLRPGSRYTVRSTSSLKTFDQLRANAGQGSAPAADSVLGSLSSSLAPVVTSLAAETHTSSGSPIAFLKALSRDLKASYSLTGSSSPASSGASTSGASTSGASPSGGSTTRRPSPSVPRPTSTPRSPSVPGSTVAATTPTGQGRFGSTSLADVLSSILGTGRTASPEQFATLVALVARQVGLPSRVVTGFRVPSDTATIPAGNYRVTTGDAWTWVEIPIAGQGWVVLDAAPGSFGNRKPQSTVSAQPTSSPTPTATPNGLITNSSDGNAVAKPSPVTTDHTAAARTVLVWVLVLLGVLLAALLLVLLLRKRFRVRRRRRSGDPRRRVVGAWQEALDVLVESGLPDLTFLTSAEVAAATHERFGGEPGAQVRYLGDAANAAIFSPTSWVGPGEADAAWRAQAVVRKSVRDRLGVRGRMAAQLRYHRPPKLRPTVGPTSWSSAVTRMRPSPNRRARHSAGRRRAR